MILGLSWFEFEGSSETLQASISDDRPCHTELQYRESGWKGLRIKNRQVSTLLNKHLNSLERLFFWILFLTRDIFGNDNVNTKLPGIKKGLKGC